MAINVTYDPDILISGMVAEQAGLGRFKQAQDKFLEAQRQALEGEGINRANLQLNQAKFGESQRQFDTSAQLKLREQNNRAAQANRALQDKADARAATLESQRVGSLTSLLKKQQDNNYKKEALQKASRNKYVTEEMGRLDSVGEDALQHYRGLNLDEVGAKKRSDWEGKLRLLDGQRHSMRPETFIDMKTQLLAQMAGENLPQYVFKQPSIDDVLTGGDPNSELIYQDENGVWQKVKKDEKTGKVLIAGTHTITRSPDGSKMEITEIDAPGRRAREGREATATEAERVRQDKKADKKVKDAELAIEKLKTDRYKAEENLGKRWVLRNPGAALKAEEWEQKKDEDSVEKNPYIMPDFSFEEIEAERRKFDEGPEITDLEIPGGGGSAEIPEGGGSPAAPPFRFDPGVTGDGAELDPNAIDPNLFLEPEGAAPDPITDGAELDPYADDPALTQEEEDAYAQNEVLPADAQPETNEEIDAFLFDEPAPGEVPEEDIVPEDSLPPVQDGAPVDPSDVTGPIPEGLPDEEMEEAAAEPEAPTGWTAVGAATKELEAAEARVKATESAMPSPSPGTGGGTPHKPQDIEGRKAVTEAKKKVKEAEATELRREKLSKKPLHKNSDMEHLMAVVGREDFSGLATGKDGTTWFAKRPEDGRFYPLEALNKGKANNPRTLKAFMTAAHGWSVETDGHKPTYYQNITAEQAFDDAVKVGDYVRIKGTLYVVEPPDEKTGKRQVHPVSMLGDK